MRDGIHECSQRRNRDREQQQSDQKLTNDESARLPAQRTLRYTTAITHKKTPPDY